MHEGFLSDGGWGLIALSLWSLILFYILQWR